MTRRFIAVFFLSICAAGHAQAAEGDKWQPYAEFEFKPGNKRTIGEVDIFIPLAQDNLSLLSANIRAMTADDVRGEHSVGLGYREILQGAYILGGYGFWDRRYTESHNTFNQLTFGAELMAQEWDARVNTYLPVGKDEKSTGAAAPTVNIVGTTLALLDNRAAEKAMGGVDVEFGHAVPLLDDTRFYLGAFHFDSSDVDNVSGPRARLETHIYDLPYIGEGSRLTLGVEAQRDSVRDNQGFAIARLRVPFGKASPKALAGLDRRMIDPIVRDVDIVSGTRQIGAGTVTPTMSINGANQTLSNIIFVSNTGLVGNAGTQASPTTLANALTQAANTLVVIDGAGGAVSNDAFVMGANTVIIGGATPLTLTGGGTSVVFNPGGTRPTLADPNLAGDAIDMANNTHIEGIDFTGSARSFFIDGVTGVQVRDVTTDGAASSIVINNSTGVDLSDVTVQNARISGIVISANSDDITFTDVTVNDFGLLGIGGQGVMVDASSNIVINNLTVTGGPYGGGQDGALFITNGSDTVTVNNMNTTYTGVDSGVRVFNSDNITLNAITVANATNGVTVQGNINNLTGSATVAGGIACNNPGGAAGFTNVTLQVNAAACP